MKSTRTVSLDIEIWKALKDHASEFNTTIPAVMEDAISTYLLFDAGGGDGGNPNDELFENVRM